MKERSEEFTPNNTQHALVVETKGKKNIQRVISLVQIEEEINRRTSQFTHLSEKPKRTPREQKTLARISKRLRSLRRLEILMQTSDEEIRIELTGGGGFRVISKAWRDFETKTLKFEISDYEERFTPAERGLLQEWWEVRLAQVRGVNDGLVEKFQQDLSEEFFEKCNEALKVITHKVKPPFQSKRR